MASSFQGWADAWGNSWGSVVTNPNEMVGSASFSITASIRVSAGEMQGSASFSISATLQLVEPPRNYSQEVVLGRRWYVKRGKKIHLFNEAQAADDFIEAEEIAERAVQKAQKTSRLARKRVRDKVLKPVPDQTIEIDYLSQLVAHFSIRVDLPALVAQQDMARLAEIYQLAIDMQEEEDIEMLLLA
jgi:hypothetical protein